ncbi:hypothetical protein, partial [Varibaculum cambriense]|uniref:hypothetical protein n=1 Tax=Varibaculum cambriense TaxID=184870 RepID=UPI0028FE33BF
NTKTDPYTSAKAGQATKPPQHARKKTHKMLLSPQVLPTDIGRIAEFIVGSLPSLGSDPTIAALS